MDNQEKCLKIWEYDYVNEEYEVWEKRIQVLNTAPELLEACKWAYGFLKDVELPPKHKEALSYKIELHKLESAIKKATEGVENTK